VLIGTTTATTTTTGGGVPGNILGPGGRPGG
jgi:hypothetical protein